MNARPAESVPALQKRTEAHYDRYPFEFLTADDAHDTAEHAAAFRNFVTRHVRPGTSVGEVGCGPGRDTIYLVRAGADVTALDLSWNSIALARARVPEAHYVRGSALSLPFAPGTFEVVVSDGVIHHTPDARRAFGELARVLKPGGALYLGVYNRRRYYFYLYTYPGRVMRALERGTAGRALIMATAFPLYFLAHLLKSRGRRTLKGARNLFYDYFLTPQASFHTREEIECWAREEGLAREMYDPSPGNVHAFWLLKAPADSKGHALP